MHVSLACSNYTDKSKKLVVNSVFLMYIIPLLCVQVLTCAVCHLFEGLLLAAASTKVEDAFISLKSNTKRNFCWDCLQEISRPMSTSVFTFGFPHCSHLMYFAAEDKKNYVNTIVAGLCRNIFLAAWSFLTHVSAQEKSSCSGFGIFSSACFWTMFRQLHPSPPMLSSDKPSSSPLMSGYFH